MDAEQGSLAYLPVELAHQHHNCLWDQCFDPAEGFPVKVPLQIRKLYYAVHNC